MRKRELFVHINGIIIINIIYAIIELIIIPIGEFLNIVINLRKK
jgi:hypothetical protein